MKRKASAMEEGLSQSDTVNIGDTFFLDAPADPDSGVYNRSGAALPVPDSLPDDWAGVPTDGLEYLFMVRKETFSTPKVKVAAQNPYANDDSAMMVPEPAASSHQSTGRPSEAWKEAFMRKFKAMRSTLGPDNLNAPDVLEAYFYPLPGRDEPAWRSYIHGRSTNTTSQSSAEDQANDIEQQAKQELANLKAQPKAPSRDLLKQIEPPLLIELLNYFNEWMQAGLEAEVPSTTLLPRAMRKAAKAAAASAATKPSSSSGTSAPASTAAAAAKEVLSAFTSSWLLALLASLNSLLDSDDIANLRFLARTCHRVIRELPALSPRSPDSVKEQQSRAWMVIAAVSDTWHQNDLWGLS